MLRRIWSFAVSLVLAFSGLTVFAQSATVTGTVTYLQRIALPSNAVVKVTLEDVSLADAPTRIFAEKKSRPRASRFQPQQSVRQPMCSSQLKEIESRAAPAAIG